MLSTCSYELNGVPIDNENCAVMVGSSLFSSIATRRTVTQVSGRHGSVPTGLPVVFDERELTLNVDAFNPKVYAESWRLMRLCASPFLTITRIMNGVRQNTRAELVSLAPDDGSSHPNKLVSFSAVFALPDVFWRSENYVERTISVTGGTIYPKTGPIPSSQKYATISLGNPDNSPSLLFDDLYDGTFGDAPITDMLFRFPANVNSVTVTDPDSKTGFTWSGSGSSQYTYFDPANLKAWRSSSDSAWSGGTNVSGVDFPAAGILQVNPRSDGSYSVSINTGGVSSGDVVVRSKLSWW